MKCQEFSANSRDLISGAILYPDLERRLRGHLSECSACSLEFSGQMNLTASLRLLAFNSSGVSAPKAVEETLRAALKKADKPIWPPARATAAGPRRFRRLATPIFAGAISLLVLGFLALKVVDSRLVVTTFLPAPEEAVLNSNIQHTGTSISRSTRVEHQERSARSLEQTVNSRRSKGSRRSPNREVAFAGYDRLPANQRANSGEFQPGEFLPLTFETDGYQAGGEIVRVEMSSGSLRSLGLPIFDDNTQARIRADLLVSEDGTARAIRFLHQATGP